MICDQLGVPLEKGQTVAFQFGTMVVKGKVEEVHEMVSIERPHRQVVVSAVVTFGIANEAGPAPNIHGMFVTAGQDKPVDKKTLIS